MGKKGGKRSKTRWRVLSIAGEDGSCGANGAYCNGDLGGGGGSLSAGEDNDCSLSPEPPSTFNGHPKRSGPGTFARVHITKSRQQQHNGNPPANRHHHHYNHHNHHHNQPLVTTERKIFDEEEYTKITTPRQDVLFKKGYLGRKRTTPAPEATPESNNSTPQTNGTNGHANHDVNGDDGSLADSDVLTPEEPPPYGLYGGPYIDTHTGICYGPATGYELIDIYSGQVSAVVVGPAPLPMPATAFPAHVPLHTLEWFNPGTPYVPGGYSAPHQPNGFSGPQFITQNRDRRKRYSTDSQNCSPQSSESTGPPGSPQEMPDYEDVEMAPPFCAPAPAPASMYHPHHHPAYLYPGGYMFGAPVYAMNGVTVQAGAGPLPVPPTPLAPASAAPVQQQPPPLSQSQVSSISLPLSTQPEVTSSTDATQQESTPNGVPGVEPLSITSDLNQSNASPSSSEKRTKKKKRKRRRKRGGAEEGSEESSSDDKDQDESRRVNSNHHHPLHQPLPSPDSSESSSCSATSSISGSEPSPQTVPTTDHTSLFLDRIHQGVEEFIPQQQPSQINQVSSSSISTTCENNILPQVNIQENGCPLLQIVESEQKINIEDISVISEPNPKFIENIIEEQHSPKNKIDDVQLTNGILNNLDHTTIDVPIVVQAVFEVEQSTPKKDLDKKIESEEKKIIINGIKSSKKGNKSKKNNSNNNNISNNNKNQKSKSENERNKNSKNKKKENAIMDKSKPNIPTSTTEISLRPDAPLGSKPPGAGAGSGSSTSKRMSKPEERLVDLLVTSSVSSQEIHLSSLPSTPLQFSQSQTPIQASPLPENNSHIQKEVTTSVTHSPSSPQLHKPLFDSEVETSHSSDTASRITDDITSVPPHSETLLAIEEDTSESSTATEPSVIELLGSGSSNSSSIGQVPDTNSENGNTIEVIKAIVEDEEENIVFNAQNRTLTAEKIADNLSCSIISEAIEEAGNSSSSKLQETLEKEKTSNVELLMEEFIQKETTKEESKYKIIKEDTSPKEEAIKEPDPPPDKDDRPITTAVTRWLRSQSPEEVLTIPEPVKNDLDDMEDDEFDEDYDEENVSGEEDLAESKTGPKNVQSNPWLVSYHNTGLRVASSNSTSNSSSTTIAESSIQVQNSENPKRQRKEVSNGFQSTQFYPNDPLSPIPPQKTSAAATLVLQALKGETPYAGICCMLQ